MFSYGNIQLKVCGITDIRSLELIQKYSVGRVGFVSDHLHGPNTLPVHEIIKLKNKSYELKLNPILLIGNLEITEIIKVINKIGIKEVCLANQYTYEEIQQLIKSTDIKISISVNFNDFRALWNITSSSSLMPNSATSLLLFSHINFISSFILHKLQRLR